MLTDKEQQVLEVIKQYKLQHGSSPTFDDIACALGLKSKSTAHYYIQSLKKKKYIYIPDGKRKDITILKHSAMSLPFLGSIAAGNPLEAYEVIESIDLSSLIQTKDRYLLKVCGDSMIESGIIDGDLVLIQKQSIARSGQIIVALVDDQQATLKEFHIKDNNMVALIPHNKDLETMVYPAHRITIQGVYLGARFDRSYID